MLCTVVQLYGEAKPPVPPLTSRHWFQDIMKLNDNKRNQKSQLVITNLLQKKNKIILYVIMKCLDNFPLWCVGDIFSEVFLYSRSYLNRILSK